MYLDGAAYDYNLIWRLTQLQVNSLKQEAFGVKNLLNNHPEKEVSL